MSISYYRHNETLDTKRSITWFTHQSCKVYLSHYTRAASIFSPLHQSMKVYLLLQSEQQGIFISSHHSSKANFYPIRPEQQGIFITSLQSCEVQYIYHMLLELKVYLTHHTRAVRYTYLLLPREYELLTEAHA